MRERILKPITALTVAFVLLLVGVSVNASGFSDTVGLPCEEAVTVLQTLGIIEGKGDTDTFAPLDTLTRAETAALVVRALGLYESGSGKQVFTDVTWEHWALDVVSTAAELGLVNGMGDGTFQPDAGITYAQAVKIAVSMLGYGVQAEALGGFPAGYLVQANQLELLKGVAREEIMTRGNMAILLYNTLDAVPTDVISFGSGGTGRYEAVDGATLLSRYRQIYMVKGTLTATYGVTLEDPGRTLFRGEAAIGTDIYEVGSTAAEGYIGQRVKVYYTVEDDTRSMLIILPDSKSRVTTIDASLVSGTTTLASLVYENGNREERVNIAGAKIVINGIVKPVPQIADLMPASGQLTLIGTAAGDVETVIVDKYDIYVVDLINTEDEEAILKTNANGKNILVLKDEKHAKVMLTDALGNTLTASDLAEWDVLSVAEAADGNVTRIIRTRESVTGVLTETSDKEVVIEGKSYSVTADARAKLSIGMEARFVLSHLGYIAGVDTAAIAMHNYGYLVAAAYSKGIDAHAQLKVFTQDGQMVVFDTEDTVRINGTPYKTNEMLDASPVGNGGNAIMQLIRYETMAESATIFEIETADDFTANPFDTARLSSFSKSLFIPTNGQVGGKDIGFRAGSLRMFDGGFLIRTNTKIFYIPEDRTKEEEYRMIDPASLMDYESGGKIYTNVSLFDVDEDHLVSAMIWEAAAGTSTGIPDYKDSQAIIKTVSIGYNEETGETGRQLTLYTSSGKEVQYIVKDDHKVFYKCAITDKTKDKAESFTDGDGYVKIYAKDLCAGDVITYTTKSSIEFDILNVIFRAESPKEYDQYWGLFNDTRAPWKTTLNRYYGSQTNAFGTVKRISESFMLMNVPDRDDPSIIYERIYPISTASSSAILRYDMKTGTLSTIASTSISPGDKAFVSWYTNSPRFIIVYENLNI